MSFLDDSGLSKQIEYIKAYVQRRIEHAIATSAVGKARADADGNEFSTTYAKINEIQSGSTNGTINVSGTDIPVRGLGSAAYTSTSDYASANHMQASNTINALTDYEKANLIEALDEDDTLNTALGKLERALDGKQPVGQYLTVSDTAADSDKLGGVDAEDYALKTDLPVNVSDLLNDAGYMSSVSWEDIIDRPDEFAAEDHTHTTQDIIGLDGYTTAGQTAGSISANDSLNTALAKIQLSIDGKQPAGNYLGANATAADSAKLGGIAAANYVKKSDITTGSTGGTISVAGTDIAVQGLGSMAYENSEDFAPYSHTQAADTITMMTGYTKAQPEGISAINTSDTLNVAIGKLEASLDTKQPRGDYLTTSGIAADSAKLGGIAAADYALLDSPDFTGTPTAVTASEGTSTTQIATTEFVTTAVDNAVSGLLGGVDDALDTLNELSAALGDDPNFSTTMTTELAKKVDKDSPNYIKSASSSNHVLTLTKGDNTTVTFTDTVYTHPDSGVTADSYGPNGDITGNNNVTISVPQITVDAKGHVTDIIERTYTSKDTTYSAGTVNQLTSGSGSNYSVWKPVDLATYVTGKVDAVDTGVMSVTAGATNGTINVDGDDITVYTHPSFSLTAGSYGPSGNVSGTNNTSLSVPQITVNANGHITGITSRTYTSKDTTYTAGTGLSLSGTEFSIDNTVALKSEIPTSVSELSNDTGYITGVSWNEVTDKPSVFDPAEHTHLYAGSASAGGSAIKVAGESASANRSRHVWFSYDNNSNEEKRVYSDKFQYNPSTDVLKVGSITGSAGSVDWGDITNKPPDYTASAHTHTADAITAMTGYSKPNSSSSISASDSLNAAVGKLEAALDNYALKNEITSGSSNGKISIAGTDVTVYTHPASNVSAGSYGPSANASPAHGGTFSVPYVTVDTNGHITAASTKTITLPADNDTKVTNTLNTGAKAYVTGTTSNTTNTGTQIFDTGVYLSETAGELVANKFTGSLNGTAAKATADASGNAITSTYATKTELSTAVPANVGSATNPVYSNASGVLTACTYSLNKTVPADAVFTDTKVTNTKNNTTKFYLTGTNSSSTNTGTQYFDTNVYVSTAEGELVATKFTGNLTGNVTGNVTGSAGSVAWDDITGKPSKFEPAAHSHNYAGSSSDGGAATSANKLNTNAGSETQPVYFSNGVPVVTTYSLNKTVPADAVFTDHTYSNFIKSGSTAAAGLVPSPGTTAGTTKFLREDATWQVPVDTKVNVTLGTKTKAYLLATSTAPTSTAAGVTAISDTGVYLGTAAGELVASKFTGDLVGNVTGNVSGTAGSVDWDDITDKPAFATVATSGSYNDLSDTPTNVSSFTNDSGYITAAHEINNSRNIEYIVGTQTASTNKFTGVTQDSALYDGKCINYKLPFAGTSSSASLNLTLSDGSTTGEIPVYISNTTRLTTHKGAGQIVMMTYNATNNAWQCDDYWSDSNYYDRVLVDEVRLTAGTNGIKNYSLIMQKPDGTWESLTTTGGQATTKAKNINGFLLGKVYRYNYSNDIAAGSLTTKDYIYDVTSLDLRYSTNCGTTLTANMSVYLVGTIDNDGLFYLDDTWWTQTVPSTEDGKVYIYLGEAYSTYQCILVAHNPVFWYKDGAFREYSYLPVHTHNYAGSSSPGGAATSADKINTDAGSATQPVYFSNGVPVATTYTLEKSVPSNAVFTDTKVTNTLGTTTKFYVTGTTSATTNTGTQYFDTGVYVSATAGELVATKFTGALNGKANDSDKLGGTAASSYATKSYVDTAVADLVGSAPETLDTLEELANALGADIDLSTSIATQIGSKVTTGSADYLKAASVSGKTLTLTKGDNSTVTFTETNTTYSAGTGLSLSGTTFNHLNSIAAGTAGTQSATSGSTLDVPYVTYDAQGHVTASGVHTHTVNGFLASTTKYAASASVGGSATSVAIEAGTDNTDRYVWFSRSDNAGRPVYDADFKYNPSTNNLTVTKINGVALTASPKFTDTTYSAGTGLSLSDTTFNHSNSITAGTVGTDSATSGSTLTVPYVTYDAQGHITATGTHTHTVSGFLVSTTKYAASASVGGAATSVARAEGTANAARTVWFSDSADATKLAYDNDFKYNPSTNDLSVVKINGVEVGSSPKFTDTLYSDFIKSGSTAAAGLVPSPGTTAGTTKFLREDATWQVPVDEKVTTTSVTFPSSNKDYYIAASDASATSTGELSKFGVNARIQILAGTASAEGKASLILGNSTAKGTAGNVSGEICLYGDSTTYTTIRRHSGDTTARSLYLPKSGGTLVCHTTDTAIGSSSVPVYISTAGVATACSLNSVYFNLTGATGTKIASNTDLNTLKTAGTYYCENSTTAVTLTNCPYTASNFKLKIQFNGSVNYGRQVLMADANGYEGETWIRSYKNGTWGTWVKVVLSSDTLDATKLSGTIPSSCYTDTVYTGSDGITLTGTNFTNSGVRSISTGSANGTISVNTNGTSANVSVYGLAGAAYLDTINNTAKGALGWNSAGATNVNNLRVVNVNSLSYWNGCYNGTSSNLEYCAKGAFGTIVTKNTGDYLPISGGTLTGLLTAKASQYDQISASTAASAPTGGGLYMNNSDITGANAIIWADQAGDAKEGILFPNAGLTTWDSIWANGSGVIHADSYNKSTKAITQYYIPKADATSKGSTSVPVYVDSGLIKPVTSLDATKLSGTIPAACYTHTHNYAGSSSAGGPATGVTGTASTNDVSNNVARHVWYSWANTETQRAYDDDFKYNPVSNTLETGAYSIGGHGLITYNSGTGCIEISVA